MMPPECIHCGPTQKCSRCGKPYPHSRNECDLVETHELTIFGVKVTIEATLDERGSTNLRDLNGPLEHSVHFGMTVEGGAGTAGASSRVIEHGVDWLYEQARQHHAEEQAHYQAKEAERLKSLDVRADT